MSLTVTQRPSATVGGEVSKWNAAGNPVLYKMTRKDFAIASINNSGGFAQIVISGDVSASFDIGDTVYFQTDGGVYMVQGTVTASAYSAPNTLVTLTTAYISSSTGYANNETLRANYAVDVEVYNSANVLLTAEPFRYSPTSKGLLTIDIASILIKNLSPEFAGDLTGTTKIFDDTNVYVKFYIKYREIWTGSAESQTNDSSNQFFAILGAMQIPAPNGGNAGAYVTVLDGNPAAEFLTKMDVVKLWRGYPSLVSIVIGDLTVGSIYAKSTDSSTPASWNSKLITIDLNQLITSQDSIDSTELEIYFDDTIDVLLSETLPVEIENACDNPVLLVARNTLGGCLTWMFDKAQDYTFDYGNDIKAERKVLRAENLTLGQWQALQDFIGLGEVYRNSIVELTSIVNKTSSRIGQQVYVVDEDGIKTGVIVIPTRNTTNTKNKRHIFELEIEYPEIF